MLRTHHCGELKSQQIGETVRLIGWIEAVRDHGGLCFFDLRDRQGLTQVLCDPQSVTIIGGVELDHLKEESVVEVTGKVVARPEETRNSRLSTGDIEVQATQVHVHNLAETLPFPLDEGKAEKVNEDLRLSYRYLDLRRGVNRERFRKRHRASQAVRNFLDEEGFLEVETPMLFKSTPEGAREYLVPSRVNPGQFYALPQSPQQFKQMLMVAGVERYYQLARCFRDEDLRADRQPEFTQIDLELSFIDREDMYALIEGMLKRVWKEVLDIDIPTPFPRMSYHEAMERFGIDKPDTRFELELVDLSEAFAQSQFKVFASVLQGGGKIKAVNAKGLADITQGELNGLTEVAQSLGAKGLAFIKVQNGEWKSPITKFFSDAEKAALQSLLNIEEGDLILFAADQWERACTILGRVRLDAAQLLQKRGLLKIPGDQYNFLWVIEFPLMLFDEEAGRFLAAHHPFTAPLEEDIPYLDSEPQRVRGQHYDIVLNGVELGGGSIRIHQPAMQKKVFEDVLKIPADIVEERFGYMLKAFSYGAPPHGGIALGFDRLVAILCGTTSIRDVIAFPKTQKGQCLMTKSPGTATSRQLRDLHIQTLITEGV